MTAALSALLLILTGCSFHPGEYPRAAPAAPPTVQPVTVGITVPQDADEAIEAAVLTLEAKLGELSDGKIKLETYRSSDVAYELQQGGAGLYLLDSAQAVQLDSRLRFIQMPFLFENANQLLTMLNSEDGTIRGSSVTRERLGGEIIGVYYGGTSWFLGKGKFYDEVGFYNSVGVLSGLPANACFSELGAGTVAEGSSDEIFGLLAQGKIKYCELRPEDEIPEETMAMVKNLELTNHRFDSRWMILSDSDNGLEPTVKSMIKEAFAYTVMQHDTTRKDMDTAQMSRLEEQVDQLVQEDMDYRLTRQSAKRYYRTNREALDIPEDIWKEIQTVKGY